MGYTIQYGQTVVKKAFDKSKQLRKAKRITTICIVALALAGLFCFREYFYPGDREVTKAALENMADNIESGQSIGKAFHVFCEEIIAGADIS